MNQKLIAAAVAAVVVAPVAAYGESSFYGRINNAIDSNDLGEDSSTDISGVASRLGFRGNTDIGNGLTAHGRYEFSTTTDKEGTGIGDTRIATVGLSGAFGRVDVGNQWSAYFNTFGTLVSPTFSLGYYLYSSVGGGAFRASNTIKYSNDFGPLHAELDVRLNEDGSEGADVAENLRGDGFGIGLSFAVNDNITIAATFDSEDGANVAAIDPLSYGDLSFTDQANYQFDLAQLGADVTLATLRAAIEAATDQAIDDAVADGVAGNALIVATRDFEAQEDIALHNLAQLHDEGDNDVVDNAPNADDATAALDAAVDAAYGITDGEPASTTADVDRVGLAVKATFGNFWGAVGWQSIEVDDDATDDVDSTFLWVGGDFSEKTNWLVGYAKADDATDGVAAVDSVERIGNPSAPAGYTAPVAASAAVPGNDDSTQVTWGVYHNLGGGMRLYYEATDVDSGDNDGTRHLLGMRIDF